MSRRCCSAYLFIFPLIRGQEKEHGKLREMTQTLSARSETLEHAALTDALTGMQNRRYFDDALKEYLGEFKRIGKPVGLMVLDLDHFKSVNDTHGHDVGDEVLRRVAQCLKDFTRYHDVAARVGGEEFAVVAPNMDLELLKKLAERIRKAVADLVIESGNVRLKVTSSFGLVDLGRPRDGGSLLTSAPTKCCMSPNSRAATASAPEATSLPLIGSFPKQNQRPKKYLSPTSQPPA